MKKKILAVVTTVVLALGCFTTVSASAESKAEKWIAEGVINTEKVTVSDDEGLSIVNAADITAKNLVHLAAQHKKDKCVKVFRVEGDADNEEVASFVVVDDTVKASKKYAIRVMENDNVWSTKGISKVTVTNGVVKFKGTKPGVYALVQIEDEEVAPAQPEVAQSSKAAVVDNSKKAPKTGEQ